MTTLHSVPGQGAPAASDPPAWREVVRSAAEEAAIAGSGAYWGENRVALRTCLPNYRWEHVQAVVRLAIRLAELTGADREIVEAAAWLHDIAKPHSRDHGRDGAIAARKILAQTDFPPHKVRAVAEAIEKHVGLFTDEPVEPLEAAVLWDADKLTKVGATAVLHFVVYKVIKGGGTTLRLLEWLPAADWQEGTVRSFNTAPARAAGRKRLQVYRAFCQQAILEFDGDDLLASD